MSLIIVEGMDNSGKSTVVQKLAHDLNLCKVATYRKPKSITDILDYHAWAENCPYPIILDRHPFISEFVYGTALGRQSLIDSTLSVKWASAYLVIYCRPPAQLILEFDPDVQQMAGVIENGLRLITLYDALMEEIPHHVYDWNNYDFIKEYIQCATSSNETILP